MYAEISYYALWEFMIWEGSKEGLVIEIVLIVIEGVNLDMGQDK
jgi:hypothetical protein